MIHPIQMLNLKGQYAKIKPEIDFAIQEVLDSCSFIHGRQVKEFEEKLALFLHTKHIITCANGTDALQIALMALDLKPNDEVIVPAFTYAATAEVIALLKLKPVMVDVDERTFNIKIEAIEKAITNKTKAIIPVHLFGQSADMEPLINIAKKSDLWIIEDNAQSLGSEYTFSDGQTFKTGTMGHIGCTSFFPSKNLGCFGDGGALCTNDDELAKKMRMIANHGQEEKYQHSIIGCNSRLDTIQAAVLQIKLRYLTSYIKARRSVASYYDSALSSWGKGKTPFTLPNAFHSYNQYTLQINNNERDIFQSYLSNHGIPSSIYYPKPLYKQEAYKSFVPCETKCKNTEFLCNSVISLPIHTEMIEEEMAYTVKTILNYQ